MMRRNSFMQWPISANFRCRNSLYQYTLGRGTLGTQHRPPGWQAKQKQKNSNLGGDYPSTWNLGGDTSPRPPPPPPASAAYGPGGGGYSDVVWTGVRGWSLQTRIYTRPAPCTLPPAWQSRCLRPSPTARPRTAAGMAAAGGVEAGADSPPVQRPRAAGAFDSFPPAWAAITDDAYVLSIIRGGFI